MKSNKIKQARETMCAALKDENLRIGYIANIAMTIYDNFPEVGYIDMREKHIKSNEIAEKIFNKWYKIF